MAIMAALTGNAFDVFHYPAGWKTTSLEASSSASAVYDGC